MIKCEHCGLESEDNFIDVDPYIDEICPEEENEETCWCKDCHQSACDDIQETNNGQVVITKNRNS